MATGSTPPINDWEDVNDWQDTPVGSKEKTGFFGRMAENLNPMPLLRAARHPIDTANALVQPNEAAIQEATDAYKKGNYGRMALSTVEAIPMLGAPIRQAEQDIRNKDWGALAGTGATAALPAVLKKVKGAIGIPNALNQVEQSAVNYATREGIPVDLGTATGNKFIGASQAIMEKQPFTANHVQKLRQAQEQSVAQAGNRLATSIAPTGTGDAVAAGEGVIGQTKARVKNLNDIADRSYGELRRIQAQPQNTRPVQVGTTQAPGPNPAASLTPAGMPVTVPNIQNLQLPTDYTRLKIQVAPIVEQLEKTIPEAQRQASPGYSALRQILDRPDAVDVSTAQADLSAIQNIARPYNELPQVKGVSKGLAASAVPTLRSSIDNAIAAAGPRATQVLERGRQATKAKYATNDILESLPTEPGQIVKRLARNDDTGVQLLRNVQQTAPKALPSVARSVVEDLVNELTYQGDVRRAQSVVRSWHNIGDQTKAILFPDATKRQNITDFVNFAEMMTRQANPSKTGSMMGLLMAFKHPQLLAAELLAGKPLTDVLFGAGGGQMAQQGIPFNLGKLSTPTAAVVGSNMAQGPPPPPQFAEGGIVTTTATQKAAVAKPKKKRRWFPPMPKSRSAVPPPMPFAK